MCGRITIGCLTRSLAALAAQDPELARLEEAFPDGLSFEAPNHEDGKVHYSPQDMLDFARGTAITMNLMFPENYDPPVCLRGPHTFHSEPTPDLPALERPLMKSSPL